MKFFLLMLLILCFIFQNKSKSQCPPNFIGTYTEVIVLGPGCRLEVDYCLSNYITITGNCDINIRNIRFIGNNCFNILPVDQNGMYGVPWELIISSIARNPINFNCFNLLNIPPCSEGGSRPIVEVSNGGCYLVIDGLNGDGEYIKEYIPCAIAGINYCKQYYSLCKENIDGIWQITVTSGDPIPQFECIEPNCYSICN